MRTAFRKRPGSLWLPGVVSHGGAAPPPLLLAQLDARSDALMGLVPGIAGMVQPFPATAAACATMFGGVAADYAGAYLLADAVNQVPAFGATAQTLTGTALANRDGVGLVSASGFNKTAVECLCNGAANGFGAPVGTAFGQVPGNSLWSFLDVFRIGSIDVNTSLFGWANPDVSQTPQWVVYCGVGFALKTWFVTPGGSAVGPDTGLAFDDGAWHYAALLINSVTHLARLITDLADTGWVAYPAGSLADTSICNYRLGRPDIASAVGAQHAYNLVASRDISAGLAAFWHHALASGLGGVVNTYTRANTLRSRISASRIAGAGTNQVGWGYNPNFDATPANGNALQTGLTFEEPITFAPIGSNNLLANTAVAGGETALSVDGASAMRDGLRLTQAAAFGPATCGTLPSAGLVVAGASNVPWRCDADYRRGTFGTTARLTLWFSGDPSGAEYLPVIVDNATTVAGIRAGASVVPLYPAQTLVKIMYGAALGPGGDPGQDCDFSEIALVKNRVDAPLAHVLTGTVAAATDVLAVPVSSIANVGNVNYKPAKGHAEVTVAGFQGAGATATFLACGAAGARGALILDHDATDLRLRVWSDTPALLATVLCGALSSAQHLLSVKWNAATGALEVKDNGTVVGSAAVGAYIPGAIDVTPLRLGADSAGNNAARALISRLRIFDA